jgi:hypothetical protein
MPPGPSRRLEAFVGLLIPPACREEVLGDLHEKYTGPWQYISLAMCVAPCVILSRIRRTTGVFVLLTDALLIYGSFLAATWYKDKTLLAGQWGFLRLAIPTVLNLGVLILERAWDFKTIWSRGLIQGAVFGISMYFSVNGWFASTMLVTAFERLFLPETNLPRGTAGQALLTEHRVEPSIPWKMSTKLLFAAAATTSAVLAVTGYASGITNLILFGLVGFLYWGLVRGKFRKE